jgi:5-(carboxyamino)imidazole ribonucleotide synthase
MIGSPDDPVAVRNLAAVSDVVTFDHELVDVDLLRLLEDEGRRVEPSSRVMAVSQSKRRQRDLFQRLGLRAPAHVVLEPGSPDVSRDLADFLRAWSDSVVVKADRGGYDGRGVVVCEGGHSAVEAVERFHHQGIAAVVEAKVDIELEVAMLVARGRNGEMVQYPVVETVQVNGMLQELTVPAIVSPGLASEAAAVGNHLAEAMDVVGILAIEFFVSNGMLLVNEIATRPHNSGHYTIEGCLTSQFEQHLRAVAGLPLGSADMTAAAAATVNLVGQPGPGAIATNLEPALAIAGAHVHRYGKEARPGRKIGHVTVLGEDRDDVRRRAWLAANRLMGAE